MFERFRSLFSNPSLDDFDSGLTRDELIRKGRIVIIDDEEPLLIDELRRSGFAVDHDKEGIDLRNYDAQLYDVAIVDYHGVGQQLGTAQGLDLIRHIRRVSPRTRLIAYTSRSLNAAESEFFRLSHSVLPKDLGLVDSLGLIESELKKALSKEHLFETLASQLSIGSNPDRQRMRDALIKALKSNNKSGFKSYIIRLVGTASEKGVEMLIGKIF